MLSIQLFWTIFDLVVESGYYEDVVWAENVEPCTDALSFAWQSAFVICNSGMNAKVGEKIAKRCWEDLTAQGYVSTATFKHEAKVRAINRIYRDRDRYFREYSEADDKVSYLQTLPHIGPITKFHLAKNLGFDCAKPDRHLQRLAEYYGTDTFTLCNHLAERVNLKKNCVDYILWRACHLRIIKTEELQSRELLVYWKDTVRTEAQIEILKVYWEGNAEAPVAA